MHVMGSVSAAGETEGYSIQEEGVAMPTCPPQPPPRFPDDGDDPTGLPATPPQAPPPPLPPPPPPPPIPPALLPDLGDSPGGLRKKKRVRSFFWKTIPEDQVKGRANLWTQGEVRQQYQIDVSTVEELFGQQDSVSNSSTKTSRTGVSRGSFREAKEEVSILDPKRGMNIGIFLKQFKRSNQVIVDDIRHGNSEPYGSEPLKELLKLLPEDEEVRKLKSYHGSVSKLSLADSFVYLLVQVPSHSLRIESMLLKEEFPAVSEAMKSNMGVLQTAARELMLCEELHAVLHLVLQAGNILNAGGYAGNAVGFKLSSLLSLADTKANKPGMNLLHFVALEAQKRDKKLLMFPLSLGHVAPAARISLETLDADLQWLTSRTRSLEENAQKDTELLQQLESFLETADFCLSSLHHRRQQLRKAGHALIDFFCEDHETFRLDDCFSIFNTFCCRFTAAVKENKEREAKEAAQWRRIQELEEQKRHSWAGGEKVGGTFGVRCSSEADMSSAVSRQDDTGLLVELLTPKSGPGSPQVRRSGSFRRSRNSPSASPSIAAERELHAFLGMNTANSKNGLEQERKVPSASALQPEIRAQSPRAVKNTVLPGQQLQRGDASRRTDPPHPQTSTQDTHHATTSYLSNNSCQAQCDMLTSSNVDKHTSNVNQHSDHNNNGNDPLGYSDVQPAESSLTEGFVEKGVEENSEEKPAGTTTGSMSVVFEKCSLVPHLKMFDIIGERPFGSRHGQDQDDLVVTDLDEPIEQIQNEQNNNTEECPVQSLTQERTEEEEEHKDKVMVWCVTGVCEIAADLTHPENIDSQTTNQQPRSHCRGSSPETPAQGNPVPAPISNQPVPSASHFDDAVAPSTEPDKVPAPNRGDQRGRTKVSTSKTKDANFATVQSVIPGQKASSSHRGTKSLASARTMKESPTSKTQQTGPKAANSASVGNKPRAVRTLTSSENQGMRRVVPISRSSKGAKPQVKHLEKPLGDHRGSSGATSTTTTSSSSALHRRGERPATAPSSRRSSFNKVPDAKDTKEPKVLSVQSHNPDSRKPSAVPKPSTKPVAKPEEKMCRSTLRALTQGVGGGGSVSAPSTPLHKATGSSSLPGFARSTASFSFRKTALLPSKAASDSSSKPLLPKTTTSSSVAPPSRSRTGSLRVSQTSRFQNSSSPGPNSKPHSSRVPAQSPQPDLLVIPKGHRRNDSGTLSDKSAHSQSESVKSIRPSWR